MFKLIFQIKKKMELQLDLLSLVREGRPQMVEREKLVPKGQRQMLLKCEQTSFSNSCNLLIIYHFFDSSYIRNGFGLKFNVIWRMRSRHTVL